MVMIPLVIEGYNIHYTVIPPNSRFLGLRKNRNREFGCLIKVPRVWRSQGLTSSKRDRELENFASLEPRVCEVLLYCFTLEVILKLIANVKCYVLHFMLFKTYFCRSSLSRCKKVFVLDKWDKIGNGF